MLVNHPKSCILQHRKLRQLKNGTQITFSSQLENVAKNETFWVICKHCTSQIVSYFEVLEHSIWLTLMRQVATVDVVPIVNLAT